MNRQAAKDAKREEEKKKNLLRLSWRPWRLGGFETSP
jgi:hypothetical protein